SWMISTGVFGLSSVSATIASNTLTSAAGRCRACGSLAARTWRLSRSATTQEAALTSDGGALAAESDGSTNPHSPSWSPPTGSPGTDSGLGALVPGAGCSAASTAGGGDCLYGQALESAPVAEVEVGLVVLVVVASGAAAMVPLIGASTAGKARVLTVRTRA